MKHDLDRMLRAIEHTAPQRTYRVDLRAARAPARNRLTRYRRVAVLATAVLVFSVMLAFLIIALRQEPALPPDPPPSTGILPEELPPWLNGTLSLTTLTYGSLAGTDLSLIGSPSPVPLSEQASTAKSQNICISLQPNASLKGTESASLLRIRPTAGEHTACEAVYYDIDADAVFCLSCELYEHLIDEPLYLDAWVRAILEEGVLISRYAVTHDDYQPYYAMLYQAMYDNQVQKQLSSDFVLSMEALGMAHLRDQLPEHYIFGQIKQDTYEPHMEIISYGIETKQCLFSLHATRKDDHYQYSYGSYLYDFATHTLTRLEGDSIGVAHSVSSDAGASTPHLAYELSRALNMYYLDGYDHIVATVEEVQRGHSSHYIPLHYSVVHYDTEKNTASILQNKEMEHYANFHTTRAAQYRDGIVFYAIGGSGGKTNGYYFTDLDGINTRLTFGAQTHLMSPEHLFWIDGEAYVKMHVGTDEFYKEESYVYFRLRDGEMVTKRFDDGTLVVPDHVYYTYHGVTRTDTRTGETVTLYDGDVLTSVCSADERYLYLLPGEADRIVCIDRRTGETGEIALPDAFVKQLAQTGARAYTLCLNYAEDTLTLLFQPDEVLLFDRERFAASGWEADVFARLYAGDTAAAFDLAAERMLPYYLHNGYSLRFTNKPQVKEALSLLLQRECYAQSGSLGKQELAQLILSTGDRLFAYLVRDGETATVTEATLAELRRASR